VSYVIVSGRLSSEPFLEEVLVFVGERPLKSGKCRSNTGINVRKLRGGAVGVPALGFCGLGVVVLSKCSEELDVGDVGPEGGSLALHVCNTTSGDGGSSNAFGHETVVFVISSLEIFCHMFKSD
jgi:hypothetical protein